MPRTPHSPRRMVLIALASVSAYVAAIALIAWLVSERGELVALLTTLGPGVLGAVVALQVVALVVMTARWMLLLRGTDPVRLPFAQAFGVQLAAHTCNVVLPFLGGDLAASWILHRRQGVPWGRSLAASIYARFAGLLTCAVLALPTSALLLGEGLSGSVVSGLGRAAGVVLLATAGLVALSVFPRPLLWLGARFERRSRSSKGGKVGAGLMLLGWWLHTTATRDRAEVAGSLALSVLNYSVQAGSILFVAHGLGLAPRPLAGLAMITVSALSGIATMVVPGGGLAEELAMYSLTRQLLEASVTSAAALVVAFGFVRAAVVALGVPAVLYYLRRARAADLAPLWQADPAPILDLLRASAAQGSHQA
ncbi:MAG: lysylphosphatidylglycerol synthase transmembrane domain-containing protein [Pseudomonadota bacterium]